MCDKMEFENEYGPEHILEWVMQLIVYIYIKKMDVIMDEMWFKLCAGCVLDNWESPDIGETLSKCR